MIYPKFKVKIENGQLKPYDFDAVQKFYQKFDGQNMALILKKWSSIRTIQQNAYLHGVVFKMVSDETGETLEQTKIDLKMEVGFYTLHQYGDREVVVLKQTRSLSTVEFNEFLKRCRKWADDFLGLYIPLPDDCSFDDLYQVS